MVCKSSKTVTVRDPPTAPESASTTEPPSNEPRLLLVASDIKDKMTLKLGTLPNVFTVIYDVNKVSLADIVDRAEDIHNNFITVGVLCHGGPGRLQVTQKVAITAENCVTDEEVKNFLCGLAKLTSERIDILGCDVAASPEGKKMLKDIEELTGTPVAGSDDKTSAAGAGADTADGKGDLFLETAGIDVTNLYFDPVKIKAWKGEAPIPAVVGVMAMGFASGAASAAGAKACSLFW
ncbi:uncharacterized protein MONBRDRAFT_30945 [Monosiga brevicollis MX1]|uniref:DUF4347 domain-containing protein n=1 Tax=Monosiga brevicollis TaxID=81824 RepID=A9UQB8_MONBE|nr:uncharacterized protein MONBRDRAFT_30945 [Monosiga brevicollis MX1]EDQ93020.1 predicted protein [Monosiga brevicollis MX1]|eukprot:XP_001742782.1 hypothetical protein [Monosiga brevicollis MX1]